MSYLYTHVYTCEGISSKLQSIRASDVHSDPLMNMKPLHNKKKSSQSMQEVYLLKPFKLRLTQVTPPLKLDFIDVNSGYFPQVPDHQTFRQLSSLDVYLSYVVMCPPSALQHKLFISLTVAQSASLSHWLQLSLTV